MLTGGCFCGAIRYAVDDGRYLTANCHCSMCRRTSAAPFVTWVVVPKTAFRYTQGSAKSLRSSATGTRYFCADCGTPIACELESQKNDIDITAGSFDDPDAFVPRLAVHEDTKLSWLGATEVPKS